MRGPISLTTDLKVNYQKLAEDQLSMLVGYGDLEPQKWYVPVDNHHICVTTMTRHFKDSRGINREETHDVPTVISKGGTHNRPACFWTNRWWDYAHEFKYLPVSFHMSVLTATSPTPVEETLEEIHNAHA